MGAHWRVTKAFGSFGCILEGRRNNRDREERMAASTPLQPCGAGSGSNGGT
jgi:hypothetical protein